MPPDDELFAVTVDEFIAQDTTSPMPLLGDERNTIIPAGGLVLCAGRPGIGKTTLALDLGFHLGSGADWLGFPLSRPLRILFVENEGPVHMFRAKLAAKREHWPHPIAGALFVQTWRWGHFSFRDRDAHQRALAALDELRIDVVIGDPLGSLGVEGVGSPEDVRNFVATLVPLGLATTRAFVFLHHFRKEGAEDEIAQLQGAWGGALDTLLTVKPTQRSDEIRLNVPKLRWARDTIKPMVVGLVRETASFELLGDEGDPRLLEEELIALLGDGTWRTAVEIATKSEGGIGAARSRVDACLTGSPHLFRSEPGKQHDRSPRATVWQLVSPVQTSGDKYVHGDEGNSSAPDPLPVGEGCETSTTPNPSRDANTYPDL
ncbi:MAG: AAA family ATPase, partial [Actinomycetota bacterium]|nr:AAA family ATPase [Actinomycetota bacterium]